MSIPIGHTYHVTDHWTLFFIWGEEIQIYLKGLHTLAWLLLLTEHLQFTSIYGNPQIENLFQERLSGHCLILNGRVSLWLKHYWETPTAALGTGSDWMRVLMYSYTLIHMYPKGHVPMHSSVNVLIRFCILVLIRYCTQSLICCCIYVLISVNTQMPIFPCDLHGELSWTSNVRREERRDC